MKDLKYYQEWYAKWVRIFRRLCDKCDNSSHRIRHLIQEIRKHIHVLQWKVMGAKFEIKELEYKRFK